MNKLTCILLVDDDNTTNFVNRMLLEDLAVTEKVMEARNGQEAINLLQEQSQNNACPQLILLDVKMPVMDGFEFLEAYDKLGFEQKESVIIVMLTTSLHPRDVDRLKNYPINGFLNKPLTKEKVRDLLTQHFHN
jgi:CheY-like chemotaxis protein